MNSLHLILGVFLVWLPTHAVLAAVVNVKDGEHMVANDRVVNADSDNAVQVSGKGTSFTSEEGLKVTASGTWGDALRVQNGSRADLVGAELTANAGQHDLVNVSSGGTVSASDSLFECQDCVGDGVAVEGGGSSFTGNNIRIEIGGDAYSGGLRASSGGSIRLVDSSIKVDSTRGGHGRSAVSVSGRGSRFFGERIDIDTNGSYGFEVNGGTASELYDSTVKASQSAIIVHTPGQRTDVHLKNVEAEGGYYGINANGGDYHLGVEGGRYTATGVNGTALWSTSDTARLDIADAEFYSLGSGDGVIQQNKTGVINILNSRIVTSGAGGHGLYAEALINADGMTIEASGKSAHGASAARGGVLNLWNSQVTTRGDGGMGLISFKGSTVNADRVSVTTQGEGSHGLVSRGGNMNISASSIVAEGDSSSGLRMEGGTAKFDLNNTFLESKQSFGVESIGANATLSLSDGSYLQAGNGVAISARAGVFNQQTLSSALDVKLDNSQVWGDVEADDLSTLDLVLGNDSLLSGAARNVRHLTMDERSVWQLTGNSDLGQFDHQGTVLFAPEGDFKTLHVKSDLTGSGRFIMNTDLSTLSGDLVQVDGQVHGNHTLVVADSGRSPVNSGGTLTLVETNGGDGQFNLYGDHVDAGAYRYTLAKAGDNWQLEQTGSSGAGNDLSTGSNAVLGSQSALGLLWNAQNNALITRLGELRLGDDRGGLWSRGVSKNYSSNPSRSRGFKQKVSGFEVGADKAVEVASGRLYLGGLVGVVESAQDFQGEAKGNINSKLLGAYGTYLDDRGYYVDAVARYSWMDNSLRFSDNVGKSIKGDYKNQGIGIGLEVGKRIEAAREYFVEPQVELTYTRTKGAEYALSNGLEVKQSASDSLEGRIGLLAGRRLEWTAQRSVQPYVKASFVNELHRSGSTRFNEDRLTMNSGASRVELGLGASLQATENSKLSVDADYAKGSRMEMPWTLTLGYRFLW
ncbi:autotransporter outer membrane beta-barrel domain-containing protein [Metapseudomonas otitidis]|uniref:autotransporter outer membrane beta-barrel domain-containing protein n=1 Tax=Metapseudomonas otitidis TaxID=319939 RepID=UPI0013F5ABE4|nr:autotransporter outer membrane beta-barrel domain-containing protein [Pseudomonas otitidis]